MLSGFLFLTGLLVALAIVSVVMLDRTRKISDIHAEISQLQVYTLNLIKTDNDFFDVGTAHEAYFKTHQSPFLQRRDSLVAQINRAFQRVKAQTLAEYYPVDDNLTAIDSTFRLYNEEFGQLEQLLFLRGFRDYGLEGGMRTHAHALENSALGLDMVTLLSLRRNEKDFFLRHDTVYIDHFNALANRARKQLLTDSTRAARGLYELAQYQLRFNQLAGINRQIGLSSLSGMRATLNHLTDQLSQRYIALADESLQLSTTAILNIRVFYLVLMVSAVVFTVLSGFWISKRLSSPIARLSKLIHKALRHKRKQRINLELPHAATEINDLVRSFNQLMEQTNRQVSEIEEKSKLLKKRNKDLKKLNHELDSFLYSTAHDLRSPLSSLMGLLQLAERDNKQPEMAIYFGMMRTSIQRQEDFIQQIVSYSKNNKLTLQIEKIALEKLLRDVLESHKYMPEAERILVWVDIREETPLYSDKNRLVTLFNNLISNAIRYADGQKEKQWIRITGRVTATEAFIEFADNGIGIEADHLHRIFDMFYRANLSSKGSGLGLFIFRETIQKLKGHVSVESRPKEGTKFSLRIPNHVASELPQLPLEPLTMKVAG